MIKTTQSEAISPNRNGTHAYSAPGRFEVNAEGMRALNSDRAPWDLLKELIQNSWDEAPEASWCRIEIRQTSDTEALVTVEDDGPGFRDPRDAYTLMGQTEKRSDPKKRGRFNLGEKEIISVALWARIETVGTTIEFPKLGGRAVWQNNRERGTLIELSMPWNSGALARLRKRLGQFRPTECDLIVDGDKIAKREPIAVRIASLPTVLQSGPGEPLRRTARKTELHILEVPPERLTVDEEGNRGGGLIYELGIPIQPIAAGYDVDVQQKVPLSPQRTTVTESYLADIYAEILNATYGLLDPDSFAETWARSAIENERRADPAAVKAYFGQKYGPDALLTSSSADSNMLAAENGRPVVNPRSMSEAERRQARRAGMQTTHQALGRQTIELPLPLTQLELTDEMTAFGRWVQELGEAVGIQATRVRFVSEPLADMLACCTAGKRKGPVVTFNTAKLPEDFYSGRGAAQIELTTHELAHAWQRKAMEHGPSWGDAACYVGSKIAVYLAEKNRN